MADEKADSGAGCASSQEVNTSARGWTAGRFTVNHNGENQRRNFKTLEKGKVPTESVFLNPAVFSFLLK